MTHLLRTLALATALLAEIPGPGTPVLSDTFVRTTSYVEWSFTTGLANDNADTYVETLCDAGAGTGSGYVFHFQRRARPPGALAQLRRRAGGAQRGEGGRSRRVDRAARQHRLLAPAARRGGAHPAFGPGFSPVLDAHFLDQSALYRAFEYKPMPLYRNIALKE